MRLYQNCSRQQIICRIMERHFTEKPTNVTLILNFENIGNESVIVEWIRSFEKLEDI